MEIDLENKSDKLLQPLLDRADTTLSDDQSTKFDALLSQVVRS